MTSGVGTSHTLCEGAPKLIFYGRVWVCCVCLGEGGPSIIFSCQAIPPLTPKGNGPPGPSLLPRFGQELMMNIVVRQHLVVSLCVFDFQAAVAVVLVRQVSHRPRPSFAHHRASHTRFPRRHRALAYAWRAAHPAAIASRRVCCLISTFLPRCDVPVRLQMNQVQAKPPPLQVKTTFLRSYSSTYDDVRSHLKLKLSCKVCSKGADSYHYFFIMWSISAIFSGCINLPSLANVP